MAVPTYKNVSSLKQYPHRYQVYLPSQDAIQYCPFQTTPDLFHVAHSKNKLEFIVPPFPTKESPCVIKNISNKPMYVGMFLHEPVYISHSRDDSSPSFSYQRYRKAFLRTSIWPDFNQAYNEGEFTITSPEFSLSVEVSLRAESQDTARKLVSELLMHWRINSATINSITVKSQPTVHDISSRNARLETEVSKLSQKVSFLEESAIRLQAQNTDNYQG